MSGEPLYPPRLGVEFSELLSSTVGAVARAQQELDAYTMERKREYEATPAGELAVPPLWFTFNQVAVELELSATVAGGAQSGEAGPGQLLCRTTDPTMVGLYGYQASAGLRVRLSIGPRGPLTIRPPEDGAPGGW
jgi:hypothetical protein